MGVEMVTMGTKLILLVIESMMMGTELVVAGGGMEVVVVGLGAELVVPGGGLEITGMEMATTGTKPILLVPELVVPDGKLKMTGVELAVAGTELVLSAPGLVLVPEGFVLMVANPVDTNCRLSVKRQTSHKEIIGLPS